MQDLLEIRWQDDERYFVDPTTQLEWFPSSRHRNPTVRFKAGDGVTAAGTDDRQTSSPAPGGGAASSSAESGSPVGLPVVLVAGAVVVIVAGVAVSVRRSRASRASAA